MPSVSISDAAKLTGKSRRTLQRHMKIGKLSAGKDSEGAISLDIRELLRVYGTLAAASPSLAPSAPGTSAPPAQISPEPKFEKLLQQAHERETWLKAALEAERERWKAERERTLELERLEFDRQMLMRPLDIEPEREDGETENQNVHWARGWGTPIIIGITIGMGLMIAALWFFR